MKVLVVVDMQNDFITGSLGTPEAQAIVPNVKAKIEEVRSNGGIVIFTRDTHETNYLQTREGKKLPVEHCIKNTWGWEITDELRDEAADALIVNKPTFGCAELYEAVCDYVDSSSEIIDEIELIGLCTSICVVSNALLLKTASFETIDITKDFRGNRITYRWHGEEVIGANNGDRRLCFFDTIV